MEVQLKEAAALSVTYPLESSIVFLYQNSDSHHENMPYIILTPLNPIFIQENCGLQGYTCTLFFLFLLKTSIVGTR